MNQEATVPTAHDEPAWTRLEHRASTLSPISIVGRFSHAHRCIWAPTIELSPVENAATYQLAVASFGDDAGEIASSTSTSVELAGIWDRLAIGQLQLTPRALDRNGRLIAIGPLKSIVKSPGWQGNEDPALDYREAGFGVITYLTHVLPEDSAHPGDPTYMWHAAVEVSGPPAYHPFQFPALIYPSLMNLFLSGAEQSNDPETAADLVRRSKELCDFLIEHPATDRGPLAGVPFSTMDQQGQGGMHEQDRITLMRIAWAGSAALRLAEVTGESKYRDYAQQLADILLAFQQPDGSWPYRVSLSDGAIVEHYTGAVVMPLLLLEQIEAMGGDSRVTMAIDTALQWIIDHPVRDGLWQQMYEDTRSLEPYVNLEQWAALETAMFVLRRHHPQASEIASQLMHFVEDQFVIFGEDAVTPVVYRPYVPSNIEQYNCYWPMDFHTANYVRGALTLYEHTGERAWARKAVAAANTIVRCQRPDGHFATAVPDQRLETAPPQAVKDWFNCMSHAANVLLALGPQLTEIDGNLRQ